VHVRVDDRPDPRWRGGERAGPAVVSEIVEVVDVEYVA
jgi:hypothetical protein